MTTLSKRRRVSLACLAYEFAPRYAIIAPARFLVGEVADDSPAKLDGLALAFVALGGERDCRVLLVLGGQPPVPCEPRH